MENALAGFDGGFSRVAASGNRTLAEAPGFCFDHSIIKMLLTSEVRCCRHSDRGVPHDIGQRARQREERQKRAIYRAEGCLRSRS